ncbi:MAG: hypothetical protein IKH92_01720 [Clostridiales bacterium]|nr:hypothetical protein [Clostridiales bacterium]
MGDCKYWEEHTGKCLNGNNMNYGHSCDNLESLPCFSALDSYPKEPCYWSENDVCKNVNFINFDKRYDKRCNYCGEYINSAYMRPISVKNQANDQSAKADAGKPRLTLVPRKIIWAIAKVREFGMKKYKEEDNWKRVEPRRYRDALFRHLMAYLDDPDGRDPESGLPVLWHVATNCAFLIELEKNDDNKI